MNSIEAMGRGMAAAIAGAKMRVFDWDEAARRIRTTKPTVASAGLGLDWEWTGGDIFKDGQPSTEDYTYLASNWAVPELDVDGDVEPCWIYMEDSPGWDSATKWPESALKILRGEEG